MRLRSISSGSSLSSFSTSSGHHEPKVLYKSHSQNVFEFKLNSPKTLNSLDLEMVHIMLKKVKEWDNHPSKAPRVALVSGTGEKAFCAGGDIVSIYNSGTGKSDPNIKADFFAQEYLLDYSLT
jgi:enoyl-CoA hydratase/carnithine racemase